MILSFVNVSKERLITTIAIYPGSFDPITYGHIDIAERSSKIFDKVFVALLNNKEKNPMFSIEERLDMIKTSLKHLSNIEVCSYTGLLVDLAKEKNAKIIIRGLRAVSEYEHEIQMAHTNTILNDEVETLFMTTDLKYSYLSSSLVKEVASFGGDITHFVPDFVEEKLKNKFVEINK